MCKIFKRLKETSKHWKGKNNNFLKLKAFPLGHGQEK